MESIYLDHHASTPMDPEVLEEMLPWLSRGGNPHAIESHAGRKALEAVEHARSEIAEALYAQPENVVFTSGATEASNIVLRSFIAKQALVCVSAIEHPSVLEPARTGEHIVLPVHDGGLLEMDALEAALDRGPSLVSVMAVNNEIGTIQPINEIRSMCEEAGVTFHTDGAQGLGRISLSVGDDFHIGTFSAHKIYGPQGIGAIVASTGALSYLAPIATGGGQERGLRPGTTPVALCVGFGAAARLAKERREADSVHASTLWDRFVGRLRNRAGNFSINGSIQRRVPHNLNISFPGVLAEDILARCPQLSISTGSACSSGALEPSRVLQALSLSQDDLLGSFRVGFGRRTTKQEVDAAVEMIAAAVREAHLQYGELRDAR